MWLDLVRAARHIRRRPVLTSVGIVSLAAGIGCALACASVVNTVLFRAFPYAAPDRLVLVWENNAKRGVGLTPTSILNFRDLKAAARTFEELGAFGDIPYSLDGPDGSERVTGYRATAGLIDQTQVRPLLGRLFTSEEDAAGGPDVVVLSHGLWQRRFGRDPSIIGKTIRLTGVPHTVIGVMPQGFLLPPIFSIRLVGVDVVLKEADVWVPFKLDRLPQRRDARTLLVLGRLKPGRSIEEGQAEASAIGQRMAADHPVDDFGMDFTLIQLDKQVLTNVQALLVLLLVVGALVLIIAATNAAHLLLADSLTMIGETAVQSALGASMWRLAGNQGVVSLLWCGAATVGAVIVAVAIEAPVSAYTRANVPRLAEVRLDGTIAAVAIAIGLALAVAVSLIPMMYAGKMGTARSASSTPAPVGLPRWRRLFVVLQLAVAIVVLSTAALLFKSADALARINPGFVAEGVHVFEIMLPETRYGTAARRIDFERRLLDRVADLPGAQASAIVDYLPFGGSTAVINFTVQGHVAPDSAATPRASLRAVSPAYFDVLSIPASDGRRFETRDEHENASVAIVNAAFARRFMAGETIVGRAIKRGQADSTQPWLTVIGVVGSVRGAGLGLEPQPEVFVPLARGGTRSTMNLIVKDTAASVSLASSVIDRVHRVDATLSPSVVTNMTALIGRATGQPFFYARLFSLLGGVALVLSLIGVYGVTALGILSRSTEIAIRGCLGAQSTDVVRLILRETGLAAGCAVIPGAVGALILQQRMASVVYGVGSTDWIVIAASAIVLSASALGTAYVATRRILKLRPLDLLKHGARAAA